MITMMDSNSDIRALPENCIANIISLTTPVDACRMSAVAPIFHSAAEGDAVWERFLPSDYREIISQASPDSPVNNFHSKKALYMYLCDNPILIDEGGKSFWLEKRSGKKCCRVSARHSWLVWSDCPQYWRWVNRPESRFKDVAELLRVCYFHLESGVHVRHMLTPGIEYEAYCLYTTNAAFRGLTDHPINAYACIDGQQVKNNAVSLVPQDEALKRWCDEPAPRNPIAAHENKYPKLRDDGWTELKLGEFLALAGETYLRMLLVGEESTQWKSGIIVEGFEIRPKNTCL